MIFKVQGYFIESEEVALRQLVTKILLININKFILDNIYS